MDDEQRMRSTKRLRRTRRSRMNQNIMDRRDQIHDEAEPETKRFNRSSRSAVEEPDSEYDDEMSGQ